jgi:hypothetical protein
VSAKHDVRQLMLADLARSGLDEKDAKRLRCKPLTADETLALLQSESDLLHLAAYQLPYFDLSGEPTDFWRVRFLEPLHVLDGKGKKKLLRYLQPKNSKPQAYFPPYVDWLRVATDPSRAVVITEGEKKAAKACKEGLNCVGLGGVWNFQSNQQEIDFLTELDIFVWEGRRVEIAFDA